MKISVPLVQQSTFVMNLDNYNTANLVQWVSFAQKELVVMDGLKMSQKIMDHALRDIIVPKRVAPHSNALRDLIPIQPGCSTAISVSNVLEAFSVLRLV